MKVSLNWVRKLTDVSIGLDQLVEIIGARLGAVEEVIDLGAKYRGATVVRVVSAYRHPDSDHLSICLIDDGNQTNGMTRNEHGLVQVICGAPNVRADMLAVWLPPGTTVPETYNTADPFVLGTRTMRGQISNGMLASQRELAIGERHSGIMEVDEPARPGEQFADTYELNDYIIDIENKMFTHRPDLFGMLGIAREIAGITGKQFHSPGWYGQLDDNPLIQEARSTPFSFDNQAPELVPRYMAVVLQDVTLNFSPILFQSYLARVGVNPINNVVDVTNYMMVLTGQPVHAYDYDKLRALDHADNEQVKLVTRRPDEGEPIALLSGKVLQPRPDAVLVSTATAAVGLGGIMGGLMAEIDGDTTSIVLEVATFDMYNIRRTSMAHGMFTDAATRFTKGQSPLQNEYVLVKAVEIIKGMAGGQVASAIIDDRHLDGITASSTTVHAPLKVTIDTINARLGTTLSEEDITQILQNVEFAVEPISPGTVLITAPYWRTDIECDEDIVEEVGRLWGFDSLPVALPNRDLTPTVPNQRLVLRDQLRTSLAAAGANETLGYSFVHGETLRKAGQDPALAYRLTNAQSPALQYYRLSLLPSLFSLVRPNLKSGHGRFALFEIGRGHMVGMVDSEELPKATESLALIVAADPKTAKAEYDGGAAYYQARHYLQILLRDYHLDEQVQLAPIDATMAAKLQPQRMAPFDVSRSLLIMHKDQVAGIVGEFKAAVRSAFKLPDFAAGFEFDVDLFAHGRRQPAYQALSRYPTVRQDITLKVAADTAYASVCTLIHEQLTKHRPKHVAFTLEPLDIYQAADDTAHKNLSFRISLTSTERTLSDKEAGLLLTQVAEAAKTELKAERI